MTNIDPRDLAQDQPLTLVSLRVRTPADFWDKFDNLTDERCKLVTSMLDACPATLFKVLVDKRDTDTRALTVLVTGHPIGSMLPTGVFQVTRANIQAARNAIIDFDSWINTKEGKSAALLTEKDVNARQEMLTSIKDYTAALGELKTSTLQNLDKTAALLEEYSVLGHRPRRPPVSAEVFEARRAADKASEEKASGDNTSEKSDDRNIYWDQVRQIGSDETFWLRHGAKTAESIQASDQLAACLYRVSRSWKTPEPELAQDLIDLGKCATTATLHRGAGTASVLQPDYVARGGVYKVSRRAFGEIETATAGLAGRLKTTLDCIETRTMESGNELDSDVLQELLSAATDLEQAYVDWKTFLTEYNAWQDDQAIEDGGENVDWKKFLIEYDAWQDDQATKDGGERSEGEAE